MQTPLPRSFCRTHACPGAQTTRGRSTPEHRSVDSETSMSSVGVPFAPAHHPPRHAPAAHGCSTSHAPSGKSWVAPSALHALQPRSCSATPLSHCLGESTVLPCDSAPRVAGQNANTFQRSSTGRRQSDVSTNAAQDATRASSIAIPGRFRQWLQASCKRSAHRASDAKLAPPNGSSARPQRTNRTHAASA
jgi:hypothetical protein